MDAPTRGPAAVAEPAGSVPPPLRRVNILFVARGHRHRSDSTSSQGSCCDPPLPPIAHRLPSTKSVWGCFEPLVSSVRLRFNCDSMSTFASTLQLKRKTREVLRVGHVLSGRRGASGVIAFCNPPEGGVIVADTDFFFDGSPVSCLSRIQMLAWRCGQQAPLSSQALISCVRLYVATSDFKVFRPRARRVRIFRSNQVFSAGGVNFQVEVMDPNGFGVITDQTEIFTKWDSGPDFDRIHIVPFQDTVPRAYDFDVYRDTIAPFVEEHPRQRLRCGDIFTYRGVQLKVLACEPADQAACVGERTAVYTEGTLRPSLWNLMPDLPRRFCEQLSKMPDILQFLIFRFTWTTRELNQKFRQRRSTSTRSLVGVEELTWPSSEVAESDSAWTEQSICMICLGEMVEGEIISRLPCKHLFHRACCDEWFCRLMQCPICKLPLTEDS